MSSNGGNRGAANTAAGRRGHGPIGALVIFVLLLGAAALVKYLFFSKRP
jgi:hypothetical protein